jgi:hypothetical protein
MTVKRVSKDPPTKRALTRQRLNTLERRTSDRQEKMRKKRKLDVLEALRKLAKDVKSKKLNIPKNTFNYGTIMKMNMNNRSLTVRLSRKVVDALKDVYRKTWVENVEYVGSVPFTIFNTRNYVKFNQPTARTNGQLAKVTPSEEDLTQYIVYHTHPVPESDAPLFTLPSSDDIKTYIRYYPSIQANLILENQGYYVIDLIETNMQKPNANTVIQLFQKLTSGNRYRSVEYEWRNLGYSRTTRERWVKFVNSYVDPIMRKQFGISIRYYLWNELGTITLLNKNSLMNWSPQ